MKWYITLALLVLCSSCTPAEKKTQVPETQPANKKVATPKTQPADKRVETPKLRLDQVCTFNGTFYAGKGAVNPKLAVSRYLKADRAGVLVTQKGASCFISISVLQEIPNGSYVKVEFPNPDKPSAPYISGINYKSGSKGYKFTSPSPVTGLKIGKDYKITVSVLKTKDSTEQIDGFVQEFRSYLDTTGGGRPVTLSDYEYIKVKK